MFQPFDWKDYAKELLRPWKLITFSIALGYYIYGAYRYQCPTWDVPVSIIMSVLTYLFAPWTVKSVYYLIQKRPKYWIRDLVICGIVIYACASGSYELYNWRHLGYWPPPTYWVNLWYSSCAFIAAGILWKFEGTFRELLSSLSTDFKKILKKNK
jgi:hypothetical protein